MTSFYCTEHHKAIGSVFPIDWLCVQAIEKVDDEFRSGNSLHVIRHDGVIRIMSDFELCMANLRGQVIELIYTGGLGFHMPGQPATGSA